MPFRDELPPTWVTLRTHDPAWASEAAALANALQNLLPTAVAVEHIGSTSIPGMPAKNCLDMMPVVNALEEDRIVRPMTEAGYRLRPETWNRAEPSADGRLWPKLVFAPPAGGRSVNVHVRVTAAPTTRRALLFRDFLRANPGHMERWARLKTALSDAHVDLLTYGQVKAPAWELLMELAEHWAEEAMWHTPWES